MTVVTMDRPAWSPRTIAAGVVAGVSLGVAYTLSPSTVLFTVALVPLFKWAGGGVRDHERRWLFAILVAATLVRVLLVLGLFAVTDHTAVPFGSLFGDEEYFIRRSLWMRNVALGLPVHRADFIYAYDDYSRTSFLYVLALFQTLLGPAPYGAHLFSILCYLAASVVLYRLVRPAYGRLPALLGLVLVLFLPSLFAWSVSALKEPWYFLTMSIGLAAAVTAGRPGPLMNRIGAAALLVGCALVAQSIRAGGLAMAGAGAAAGLALSLVARRPRLAVAIIVAALLIVPFVVTRGDFKDRVVSAVREVAAVHWGHVNTPGYVYTVLDGSFYTRRAAIDEMTVAQGVRYVVGSIAAYVAMPLPWTTQSRTSLAYLPEQLVWYLMVALAPIGIVAGLRRDALLTSLLLAYAAIAVALVALTSGNIGTLVRHRGLAVPYMLWLSTLGACDILARVRSSEREANADHR
jgi:4-amino-4-deoxy-L-arabinose transferase-like glycosyltransferase